MQSQKRITKQIQTFIYRGVNILEFVEGIQLMYKNSGRTDNDYMPQVLELYNSWRTAVATYLKESQIDLTLASFFDEPDTIPRTLEFIEPNSTHSSSFQDILKKVYTQTKIKNEKLREIAKTSSVPANPQRKKPSIELIFPELVQWEKVTIKIKEGQQDIEIWYGKKYIKTANYIELEFSSTKKEHRPNRAWIFLTILSVLNATDIKTATINTLKQMMAKQTGKTTGNSNVHQTKKNLSLALRKLFKTNDDPFSEQKDYYEPKFKLLPAPILRNEEPWQQGGRLNENTYEEQLEE